MVARNEYNFIMPLFVHDFNQVGVQRLPQDTETLATHVKGNAENVLTQHTQDGTPSVEAQTTLEERYGLHILYMSE